MEIIILLILMGTGFLIWFFSRLQGKPTTESFLVANRNIAFPLGAVTLTASWTQAIALVVGATFAYQSQWHFLWFILPNIGVLIFMGFLAPKIQEVMPRGYTLPQVVGQAFGPGVRTLFFLSAIASLVYIIAVTMTALQQWISQQTNVPPWQISIIIGAFAFLWVIQRGLLSAVIADVVKISLIGAGIIGVVCLHIYYAGIITTDVLISQSTSAGGVLWAVGIPLAVTFLASIMCTPDIAERAYAVDKRVVRRSYFGAAVLFAIIVVTYGSVGFLAKGLGIVVSGTQPPALAVLQTTVPQWAILVVTIAFVVLLTAGLASMLASAGDIMVIEVYRRFVNPTANNEETIRWSRIFIALAVLGGTFIATLNFNLSILIQSMAAIRGEVVIPMLFALFWPKAGLGRFIFWGMIVGVVGGVALIFGGSSLQAVFGQQAQFFVSNGKPLGALFSFLAPLCACFIAFAVNQMKNKETLQIVHKKT